MRLILFVISVVLWHCYWSPGYLTGFLMGQHHVELSFFISKPSIMFMLSGVCIADTVVWARERGIWLTKKLNVGLMLVMICLELCTSYIVVTTTFIIFSSNKSQNGDILVLANPGSPGKWPLKWRERERERRGGRERERERDVYCFH